MKIYSSTNLYLLRFNLSFVTYIMDHAARINVGCIKGHKISAGYLQISCQTSHQLRNWVAIGASKGVGDQKDLGGHQTFARKMT